MVFTYLGELYDNGMKAVGMMVCLLAFPYVFTLTSLGPRSCMIA